jgi:hypothetical protein
MSSKKFPQNNTDSNPQASMLSLILLDPACAASIAANLNRPDLINLFVALAGPLTPDTDTQLTNRIGDSTPEFLRLQIQRIAPEVASCSFPGVQRVIALFPVLHANTLITRITVNPDLARTFIHNLSRNDLVNLFVVFAGPFVQQSDGDLTLRTRHATTSALRTLATRIAGEIAAQRTDAVQGLVDTLPPASQQIPLQQAIADNEHIARVINRDSLINTLTAFLGTRYCVPNAELVARLGGFGTEVLADALVAYWKENDVKGAVGQMVKELKDVKQNDEKDAQETEVKDVQKTEEKAAKVTEKSKKRKRVEEDDGEDARKRVKRVK